MYTTLISASELASLLASSNATSSLVILDCRHDLMDSSAGFKAYQQAHLPGAQFAHLDQQLSGSKIAADGKFKGRHPLPDQTYFLQTLRNWGIDNTTQVIAYDAQGGMYAARLWWMLRWVGHSAVAVLDGSLPAWVAQGLPTTAQIPAIKPGHIGARPSLVTQVSASEVEANLSTASLVLVDARAPDRYRGENESMDPVGGHIPGASNRFFKDNLEADGCFKSSEQLRAEWSKILPDATHAIMQCGSGVTACHNLLALAIAGLEGAALYPGSWSEWCSDPARPVARGTEI